jgi:hypothetical protein
MWISPAYERDYRDWIAKGQFDHLVAREHKYLAESLAEQHPALIATSLSTLATCYHTRGAVKLLEKQQSGWHDTQAGYWASLYALRFEIIAVTLPAWSHGRSFNCSTELAVALAFSRLFQQAADNAWLERAMAQHFDTGPHVTPGEPGAILLTALAAPKIEYSRDELLKDRRACCRSRDAYPTRPTEIIPIGVLDLEAILHYPDQAAFSYSANHFEPTEDDQIVEAIANYHISYP